MNRNQSGWPQTQTSTAPGAWPANLLPATPGAWPVGKRPSCEAEELLGTAIAWWDVNWFTPGDRWLRNRGTGGSALDARLGSSTVANSNDPLYLAPEGSGYVCLPDTNNYLSVPDSVPLRITGDLDVRACGALDDWTPAVGREFACKTGTSGNRGWSFGVASSTGNLYLQWTTDGTNWIVKQSTAAPTIADGAPLWIRATLDVDNGSSQNVVTFYTSTDGSNWTQLGNAVTTAGTTSIYSSTGGFGVGSNVFIYTGKFYRAIVKDGIDGTTVLDVDCDAIADAGATSFTAATGQTVTINRSTSGRKTVAMPSKTKGGTPVMLFGTDDYCEVQGSVQHAALNFPANTSYTMLAGFRMWTGNTTRRVIDKRGSSGAGYMIANYSTLAELYVLAIDDFGVSAAGGASSGTFTYGAFVCAGAVLHRHTSTIVGIGTIGANAGTSQAARLANISQRVPFSIGRVSEGTTYTDMEFTAAAIFRRALTSREISLITAYYQARSTSTGRW